MTARRRAALRKAQLAAARKRKGKRISRRRAVTIVSTVSLGYLVGREITGTYTYRKNKEKFKNIRTRKRVGYKWGKISKAEYRAVKYADAMESGYDNPPSGIGPDRRVKIPVYRSQFRTRKNRRDVFADINASYAGRRSTFVSRSSYRKAKYNAKPKRFYRDF